MLSTLAVGNVLGFFVKIDAQANPWSAIFAALAVGLLLWFVVSQATRRDARRAGTRAERGNRRDRR